MATAAVGGARAALRRRRSDGTPTAAAPPPEGVERLECPVLRAHVDRGDGIVVAASVAVAAGGLVVGVRARR